MDTGYIGLTELTEQFQREKLAEIVANLNPSERAGWDRLWKDRVVPKESLVSAYNLCARTISIRVTK